MVSGKPGEMTAGIAFNLAARRMKEAAQLEEHAGRVEKGMAVRAIDGDPLLVARHMMTAESTGNPLSSRPLLLRIGRFLACPAFATHFPQELEGITTRQHEVP